MGDILDTGAKKRAQKQADLQRRQLAEQKRKEDLKSAEEEDEISRRRAIAQGGGTRGSLLATSERGAGGLQRTLG